MKEEKKNVIWLGVVSFFTDVSSEMIFPILPIFLTTVLKANMTVVGLIEGIAESTASLLKLLSGWLSDKLKKRKMLVFSGYTLSTITKPLLAVATSWTHVLGVRFFDRVGKGIRTSPRDALLASSIEKKKRGWAFGLHRTLDTTGAIVGTLIAALLLYKFVNGDVFKLIFWLSVIPGAIAIILLLIFVKETKSKKENKIIKFNWRSLSISYKKLLFVIIVFSLANFSYAFFLLKAKDAGLALALIPIIYLVYNIFYAGFAIKAGKISDKIGRKKVMIIGYILFAFMALGFAYITSLFWIWVLFALYGLFMALTDGVTRAYISDIVAEEKRGFGLGAYHMFVGLAVFPANFIGGLLWQKINAAAPFIYAAALALLAAFLLIILVEKE